MKLTALAVARAHAAGKSRAEFWDTVMPGLGLRVTDKGAKSWTVLYRAHGRQRRATLGRYPALSLAEAREHAASLMREVENGVDPAAEAERRQADLFEPVVNDFIERHARPNNRGWRRQERDLHREFVPLWRGRSIASIRRRDILDALDRIADRTSPRRANRYLALVKKLFAWAVERDLIDASPAAAIKPPGREMSRDRVLSGTELRLVWQCSEREGWPFGDLFRVLSLTAQRLGEVAAMRWGDVDTDRAIWTVPAEISKNGIANEVPLSPAVLAIL
ncbi:MAG: tyrosine-type recombinase/integrase, partial [Stellaceae bacterium]